MSRPMRVILAGSDGENMLKGIFAAQEKGLVQPVLVGDRARTITVLEQFGLEREPYTMVDTPPGHNITQEAIDIVNSGDGDVLMRGNIPTRDFLMPVLDKTNHLRTGPPDEPRLARQPAGVPQAPGAQRHDRGHQAQHVAEEGDNQATRPTRSRPSAMRTRSWHS